MLCSCEVKFYFIVEIGKSRFSSFLCTPIQLSKTLLLLKQTKNNHSKMSNIFEEFEIIASSINQCISNFKKDSASRKTSSYYTKKIDHFRTLLDELNSVNTQLDEVNKNDDNAQFFDSDTYANTLKNAEDHLAMLKSELNAVTAKATLADSMLNFMDDEFQKLEKISNTVDDNARRELAKRLSDLNTQILNLQSEVGELKKRNRILELENRELKCDLEIERSEKSGPKQKHNNAPALTFSDIIKLVPKYKGKSDELRVYVNKIDELFSYIRPGAEEATFVSVIKNHLLDEAALILLDEDSLDTWEEIKKALQQNFNPMANHANNIALLQKLKQDSSESVSDFCTKIKSLLMKLKSAIPEGTTKQFWFNHCEQYAIQCLEDGLADVSLQSRIVAAKKPTFHAAQQYAIEVSDRLNAAKSSKASSNDAFCNYCKKRGHSITDCTLKSKSSKESTSSNPSSSSVASTSNTSSNKSQSFRCEICEKNNHTTTICYKNPKNATKTNQQNVQTNNSSTQKNHQAVNSLNASHNDNSTDDASPEMWLFSEN